MFNKILAKDFKGLSRQKRGITLAVLPTIVTIFAIVYVVLLYFVMKYVNVDVPELGDIGFGQLNYVSSVSMLAAFSISYGLIVTIIMAGSLVSSEIKNKQWVLPLNAGHSSRSLFLSKLISSELWILGGMIVGFLIHFLFTVIFCSPSGAYVWQILATYLLLILMMAFYVDIIISLNFITKKSWIGIVIVLLCVIILPDILAQITVGGESFVMFTPFSIVYIVSSSMIFSVKGFFNIYTTAQWIINTATYLLIAIGLPVWAISASKIKAIK